MSLCVMPMIRVTVTLPPDLVRRADRVARQQAGSRSAVLAQALRAYLAGPQEPPLPARRVAEPGADRYAGSAPPALARLSHDALLAELRQRLGAPAVAAASNASLAGPPRLDYNRAALAELCRRHRIRTLSLFGSVLSDDFGPDSDVDVLVEFEPGHTPGLAITDTEDELSALFGGRRVHLVTERSLHRLIRDRVLSAAVVQYAA